MTVCLAVVISLPGISAGLCSLHCLQFPLDMVKDTLLFVVVGRDFGRAVSLKHRALGHPVEILASGSKLLSYEPGRGLHLEERQSFFQISCPKPLSPQGQAWLLLEQGNQPVSICAPCVSEQKPSVVLGGLCLSRQPGPVGEPQGWLSWCTELWYLGLVVPFSLTGSSPGLLFSLLQGVAAAGLDRGFHGCHLPLVLLTPDYL